MTQLADTSAWFVLSRADTEVQEQFEGAVTSGGIATCDAVAMELLYSAQDHSEFQSRRGELDALPRAPIGEREWARALEVYEALAERGPLHHRSVKHPDLLIAAAAESAELEVLHYDEDYDRIASVTGQPVRWIVPRGAL